jgi:hypothetical protein
MAGDQSPICSPASDAHDEGDAHDAGEAEPPNPNRPHQRSSSSCICRMSPKGPYEARSWSLSQCRIVPRCRGVIVP